jgi:isocitrate dehydrogenase kinase/phosphatase
MSEDKGGFDRYLEPGLIVSVRAEARLEVAQWSAQSWRTSFPW